MDTLSKVYKIPVRLLHRAIRDQLLQGLTTAWQSEVNPNFNQAVAGLLSTSAHSSNLSCDKSKGTGFASAPVQDNAQASTQVPDQASRQASTHAKSHASAQDVACDANVTTRGAQHMLADLKTLVEHSSALGSSNCASIAFFPSCAVVTLTGEVTFDLMGNPYFVLQRPWYKRWMFWTELSTLTFFYSTSKLNTWRTRYAQNLTSDDSVTSGVLNTSEFPHAPEEQYVPGIQGVKGVQDSQEAQRVPGEPGDQNVPNEQGAQEVMVGQSEQAEQSKQSEQGEQAETKTNTKDAPDLVAQDANASINASESATTITETDDQADKNAIDKAEATDDWLENNATTQPSNASAASTATATSVITEVTETTRAKDAQNSSAAHAASGSNGTSDTSDVSANTSDNEHTATFSQMDANQNPLANTTLDHTPTETAPKGMEQLLTLRRIYLNSKRIKLDKHWV